MKGLILLAPWLGIVGLGGFQSSFVVSRSTLGAETVVQAANPLQKARDQEIGRIQVRLRSCDAQLDAWHERFPDLAPEEQRLVREKLTYLEQRRVVCGLRLQTLKYVSAAGWPMVHRSLESVLAELTEALRDLNQVTTVATHCPQS